MQTIRTRWSWIVPDWYVNDVTDIDVVELKAAGILGVILDFDNTLIASNSERIAKDREKAVVTLIQTFGPDRVIIVSNKLSLFGWNSRLDSEAKRLAIQAYATGWLIKPLPRSLKKAARQMKLAPENVLVIGDLISTDVAGVKLAGMKSLLITPVPKSERLGIRLLRTMERWLFQPVFPHQE